MPITKTPSALPICLAIALLLAVGLWHLHWVTKGWHIPGLSGHEFRQTQTILTVHAMKSEGFRIDYSTPVLGKPWSIPFEFPLYQYVVARVSTAFDLNEAEAGRWVSLLAFYLAIPALVLLLRAAGFSPVAAVLGTAPVFCAPVYLLYSRAVLIESTAFCASTWFLYFLVKYRLGRSSIVFAGMLLCGVAAVLVKSTTWAVFCLPWAVWVLRDLWQARRAGWRAFGAIAEDVLLIGVPLLAVGFGWVWITDQIKEMNPIAGFLTSKNLAKFNFGTPAQHVDPQVWKALWSHWMAAVMPWWSFLPALLALVIAPAQSRIVFVLGAIAFLLGQFVFINLYAIHDYYLYANAVGICLAVGAVVAGLWDYQGYWYRGKAPAVLLLGAVLGGQFVAYQREFFPLQVMWNSGSSSLTDAIKWIVKPDEVVVMHAGDWASLIAYHSDRRMLVIPDSQMFFHPDAVQRSIDLLKDERVPLVIFRGESRSHPDWLRDRIKDFHLQPVPLCISGEFTLYAAADRYRELRALLEERRFSEVDLNSLSPSLKLAPYVPLAGTAAGEEMSFFAPLPADGSLPYGLRFYMINGHKMLFAHSPTVLRFPIPEGASKVELGYRMDPSAYGKDGTDGVFIIAEVVRENGQSARLYEEWMAPDGDRQPRHVAIELGKNNRGTLVLMCTPGPGNNTAYDWALFEDVRIR